MKAEYAAEPNNSEASNADAIFSKFHSQHHHQRPQKFPVQPLPHRPPPPHFSHHHHHHHHTTSEDDDSTGAAVTTLAVSPITAVTSPSKKLSDSGDGATIEVSRRPRGRPPGSKNKPKPPVIITRDPEPSMSPYILEVAAGVDIVEAVARFSRRRNVGLCVLTGSGAVANVSLRQPSATPGATVTFHGRFEILSLSATLLAAPPSNPNQHPQIPPPAANVSFTISLAGPQGQIVGGIVSGPLVAAATVYIVAASFDSPSYNRLPPEGDSGGNSVSGSDRRSPSEARSGEGNDGGAHHHPVVEMSMYGGQLQSEVMWAPGGRQQPPPY